MGVEGRHGRAVDHRRSEAVNDGQLMMQMLETAWGIIANASGGNWAKETPQWRDAARKWSDAYHLLIKKYAGPRPIDNRLSDMSPADREKARNLSDQMRALLGNAPEMKPCPVCAGFGKGKVMKLGLEEMGTCPQCGGTGRVS